jgi:hypothetical protein
MRKRGSGDEANATDWDSAELGDAAPPAAVEGGGALVGGEPRAPALLRGRALGWAFCENKKKACGV